MGTSRARLVAKVAAAIANRTPEGVAQGLPGAVPLAELMMTCLSLGTALHHVFTHGQGRGARGGGGVPRPCCNMFCSKLAIFVFYEAHCVQRGMSTWKPLKLQPLLVIFHASVMHL